MDHLFRDVKLAVKTMFGINDVNNKLPTIINLMIARNFKAKKNMDGSSWAGMSEGTRSIRFDKGLAKISKDRKANRFPDVLKASGDYYTQLKDIENAAFKKTSVTDIVYGANGTGAEYTLSTDDVPGLWNEGEHKISGAVSSKDNTNVPKRQVLFWDDKGVDRVMNLIKVNLDKFWG